MRSWIRFTFVLYLEFKVISFVASYNSIQTLLDSWFALEIGAQVNWNVTKAMAHAVQVLNVNVRHTQCSLFVTNLIFLSWCHFVRTVCGYSSRSDQLWIHQFKLLDFPITLLGCYRLLTFHTIQLCIELSLLHLYLTSEPHDQYLMDATCIHLAHL